MANTLQTYLTEVRRLLHDANAQFWSDSELTDYINDGRNRVVADTGCSRLLQSVTLNVNNCTGTGSGGANITGVSPVPDQTWVGGALTGTGLTTTNGSNAVVQQVIGTTLVTSGQITAGPLSFVYYQEAYPFAELPANSATPAIDVLNITVLWGNTRITLGYKPWSEYNTLLRSYVQYQQRPSFFSMYGQSTVFIGPIADQSYVSEWDTVVIPVPLVNYTDVDTILYPYTMPVAWYAAYKAKVRDQSWQESEMFQKEYMRKVKEALVAQVTRRIPNPYQRA